MTTNDEGAADRHDGPPTDVESARTAPADGPDRPPAAPVDDQQRRTIEGLIDALPIPVTLVGDDGRYRVVNRATEALMGIAPGEHLGRTVAELYPPDVVAAIEQVTGDPSDAPREITVQIRRAAGPVADFRLTGFRVGDEGWGYAVIDDTALHAARRRIEVLADITGRLLTIDDLRTLADAVQDVVAAELGAFAAGVALVEPGGLRYLSMRPYPPEVVAEWERFPLEAQVPATWAIANGSEVWIDDPDELFRRFPDGAPAAAAMGITSIGVIPLSEPGRSVGVLTLAWQPGSRLRDEDRQWCRAVANALTPAIIRVQRSAVDRHVADVLQRALLPAKLPTPGRCDIGVSYRAAGEGQVGGDTYDVIELADGRVVALIADVCGRGVDAAAATSTIRHSLSAALLAGLAPIDALAVADEALTRHVTDTLPLASAAIAVVTHTDDGCHASITLAGHPPPLLIRRGEASFVGTPGALLGMGAPSTQRHEFALDLTIGDLLVLYTDGLTDTPRPRLSEHALLALAGSVPSGAPQTCASWLIGATSGTAEHRDDTAVVVLRPS